MVFWHTAFWREALRATALISLVLAAAPARAWSPAEIARLETGEPVVALSPAPGGDATQIRAAIDIPAPAKAIWSIMTDCAHAQHFVPGLESCRVLERDPAGRWEIREHEIAWVWFLPRVRSVFRADYDPPKRLRFHRIAGTLTRNEGEWRLTALPEGGTRLSYDATIAASGRCRTSWSKTRSSATSPPCCGGSSGNARARRRIDLAQKLYPHGLLDAPARREARRGADDRHPHHRPPDRLLRDQRRGLRPRAAHRAGGEIDPLSAARGRDRRRQRVDRVPARAANAGALGSLGREHAAGCGRRARHPRRQARPHAACDRERHPALPGQPFRRPDRAGDRRPAGRRALAARLGRRAACPSRQGADLVRAGTRARLRRPGGRRYPNPPRADPGRPSPQAGDGGRRHHGAGAPARRRHGGTAEEHFLHVGRHAPQIQRHAEPDRPLAVAMRSGDVVDAILEAAGEWQADLIGMPTAGHRGFLDALRGSTSERVLRQAPCPVLTVPAFI